MTEAKEKEFIDAVEEFFNEEDTSVGLYSVGKVDAELVSKFEDSFEGIKVLTYTNSELEIKLGEDMYKVSVSQAYDKWKVTKYR